MTSVDRKRKAQDMADTDMMEVLRKELLETNEELFELRQQIQQQHQVAAQVHRSLLPRALRHLHIDVDVRFLPAEPLGSDYFQVRVPLEDPCACYITMCHVNGQGLASALLASRISSEARHFIEEAFSPADMVHSLNRFVYEHFHEVNTLVTFMAARIDLNRRFVTYSAAGHPGAMVLRPGKGLMHRLPSQHRSIGVGPEILKDNSESTLELLAGDRLFFFADGITRSTGGDGQLLGQSGLAQVASDAMSCDLFEMLDEVLAEVRRFRDAPAKEDMSLVVAEIK